MEERRTLHRAAIKIAILADKAKKANITVSKEEIDKKIAEQDAKKVTEAATASKAESPGGEEEKEAA